MKKITAILQGRMGSKRLPGKILKPLAGKPMIQHVYDRLLSCECIDEIVVATTTLAEDDVIEQHFLSQGTRVFRGSSNDPLDRYYQSARSLKIKHILRAMGDCPFIDPSIIEQTTNVYFSGKYDFCHLVGEFPSGLDTTIFSFDCLENTWQNAAKKSEREHITPYITTNPTRFKIGCCQPITGLYHHRWVVDHAEDYEFAKAVYAALQRDEPNFSWKNVVNILTQQPELAKLNSKIRRDEGYLRSLQEDRYVDKK